MPHPSNTAHARLSSFQYTDNVPEAVVQLSPMQIIAVLLNYRDTAQLYQGGVLSPILFTVYTDDLLTELEKTSVKLVAYRITTLWVLYVTQMMLHFLLPLPLLLLFALCLTPVHTLLVPTVWYSMAQ